MSLGVARLREAAWLRDAEAVCARDGHAWAHWDFVNGGWREPESDDDPVREDRLCRRCGRRQSASPDPGVSGYHDTAGCNSFEARLFWSRLRPQAGTARPTAAVGQLMTLGVECLREGEHDWDYRMMSFVERLWDGGGGVRLMRVCQRCSAYGEGHGVARSRRLGHRLGEETTMTLGIADLRMAECARGRRPHLWGHAGCGGGRADSSTVFVVRFMANPGGAASGRPGRVRRVEGRAVTLGIADLRAAECARGRGEHRWMPNSPDGADVRPVRGRCRSVIRCRGGWTANRNTQLGGDSNDSHLSRSGGAIIAATATACGGAGDVVSCGDCMRLLHPYLYRRADLSP